MSSESWLHEFGAAMRHLGECEKHRILYVEVDPTKPKGCPKCNEEAQNNISNSEV